MEQKGQKNNSPIQKGHEIKSHIDNFVLEKGIFSNIFEKDIRRVYIYKKAERLAKAIYLVSPAFRTSPALRDRMDAVAIGLVDAAILPPMASRDSMSRELLALSSVLSIGRTGGLLSVMNAELISREAHQLLQEVASYEEPRLFLDDAPSLAALAKEAGAERSISSAEFPAQSIPFISQQKKKVSKNPDLISPRQANNLKGQNKGQGTNKALERREAIKSILSSKGPSYIKDISTLIRDVSEKTIQRELQSLIESGEVIKKGERRWTVYSVL